MGNTLLQKANAIESERKPIDKKQMQRLAKAWVDDKVALKQVTEALGIKNGQGVYSRLAIALKDYINSKK